MEYAEQLLEKYHSIWIFSGTAAAVLLAASAVMFIYFRIPEMIRKRRLILALACVLVWQGSGVGSLNVRAGEAGIRNTEEEEAVKGEDGQKKAKDSGKREEPKETEKPEESEEPEELEESKEPEEPEELEEPKEPEETEEPEDVIAPQVSFLWRDEQGNELEQEAYYQTGKELILELIIQEENLDMEETKLYLEAFDASLKSLDTPEVRQIHGKAWSQLKKQAGQEGAEQEKIRQERMGQEEAQEKIEPEKTKQDLIEEDDCYELKEEEPGVFRLRLHLKTEANYQVSARIQDNAGNIPPGSREGCLSLGGFCLDRTAPCISNEKGIRLEAEHQTFFEKLINHVTFGYFCQPDLRVKIQAFDEISGIGGITYVCEGIGGEEEPEPLLITGTARPGEALVYEEKGAQAFVSFFLPSSFQGTIRAGAWDQAGTEMENQAETKGILIESEEMHQKTSHAEVFLEGVSGGRGSFYREDVSLRFVMEDTFSGIRSISLQAGNQEEQMVFEEEGQEIQRTVEQVLTIPAEENNRNEITVQGSLTDFAGHTTGLTEIPVIHIDTAPPQVEVEWLNQDVRNEKYYQADQTARITVRERNFDPDQVQLELTGMEAGRLSWTHRAGEGCNGSSDPEDWKHSDSCAWTADLVFDQDGEYSFGFSCQDAAGNRGSYGKTDTFVIDKTPPVLLAHWDNSKPAHELYYSQKRSVVLEVRERNLSPESLKISMEASHRGEAVPAPEMGVLRQWEEESWRAGITFEEDGRYEFELHCMDLAGNEAKAYRCEEFVIDRTPPKLSFENVRDSSANRGAVAPRLHVTDTNFDPDRTSVSFSGSNGTGETPAWAKSSEEYGFTLLWGDFERVPENDDLYRIKAKAGDLAGNITEAEIAFSVNRFGSVYELEEATAHLAGPGGIRYASGEPELVITEYNPDFLEHYQVTSSREGETVELLEGRDYSVEKTGTKDTWKTYRYQIGKENFQKEGIYLVTLSSRDRAKNVSNNRIKEKSLEFIVDKTGPSIVVTGVKDRERIQGSGLKLQADVKDAFALAGAEVYVNGQCAAAYDREQLQDLDGMLACPISGARAWQTFAVKAWDESGNVTETEPIRFLVTEHIRFRFFGDDKPKTMLAAIFIGLPALAGACLTAAGRIRRKLKKDTD